MDIDLLSKMVKELILDNDRVVLPGLGSFVAEVVPSTFSDKGYTINPPYRRLYFRANPSEGLELIEFYARTNKVSQDVAERIIRDFISEMRQILHTKKTVVFPGLGRLRATKENNLFFVADEGLDIYPAGFGLEPISLKTHQETSEEVTAAVAGLRSLLEDVPQPQEVQTQDEPSQEAQPQNIQPQEPQLQEQQPEISLEPVSEPVEPKSESVPEPISEPDPISEQKSDTEPKPAGEEIQVQKPRSRTLLKALLAAACILLLLTVVYAIVGRIYPEWIDQFLYTPEELKILHHKL
jgi:nucleoid DNA-binding protein